MKLDEASDSPELCGVVVASSFHACVIITSDRDERRAWLGGRALAADTNARLSHSEGACERGGVGRRGAAVRLAVPVLLLGASLAAAFFASRAFTVMPKVQTKLLNKQVLLILQAHSFTLTHSNK